MGQNNFLFSFLISLSFGYFSFRFLRFGLFYRSIFNIKIDLLVKYMTEINNCFTCLKNITFCYDELLIHFISILVRMLLINWRLSICLFLSIFSNFFKSIIVSRVGKSLLPTKLNEKYVTLLAKKSLFVLPSFKNSELFFVNMPWYWCRIPNLFPFYDESLKVQLFYQNYHWKDKKHDYHFHSILNIHVLIVYFKG